MDPCDFDPHAPALRNDCNSLSLILSVSVIVSWTVLIFLSLSQGINSFWLFRTFSCFDVLSTGERNFSLSAMFKLAQEDPIWFRVRRLNHSAMTAWQSSYFHLCGSFFVELLCELILSQSITHLPFVGSSRLVDEFSNVDQKLSKSARYELHLDEFIWVLVKRPQRTQLWLLIRFPNYCRCRSFHLELFFLFFKDLPLFGCFGLSDGLMCWILVSEKCRSQLHWNLLRETPYDFSLDALTTRPLVHDRIFFISVGDCMFVQLLCELSLS